LAVALVAGLLLVQSALTQTARPAAASAPAAGQFAPGAAPADCVPGAAWETVAAPDGGSYANNLYGVTALTANDAWAVGEQYSSSYGSYVPMIEHWNGSTWAVATASPYGISLRGASGVATN